MKQTEENKKGRAKGKPGRAGRIFLVVLFVAAAVILAAFLKGDPGRGEIPKEQQAEHLEADENTESVTAVSAESSAASSAAAANPQEEGKADLSEDAGTNADTKSETEEASAAEVTGQVKSGTGTDTSEDSSEGQGSEAAGGIKGNSGKTDTTEDSSAKSEAEEETKPDKVTAVGDSIMVAASEVLQDTAPELEIDAKKSRQMSVGADILKRMVKEGKVEDTVVIELGTNGGFSQEEGQELIDLLGKDRTIYWVLVYGKGKAVSWQTEVNKTIQALASANSNLTVIDWPSVAKRHPEYIYSDGIHLTEEGQTGYAEMITDAIGL